MFGEGRRFYGPGVIVVARVNALPHMRLGLSVGRRIGNAVVRNRVKKHLRECFRSANARPLGGLDLVAIPRSADALGDIDALRNELDRIMRKAHHKLIGSTEPAR